MSSNRQHRLTASRAADLLSGNYKTWNRLARDMRAEPPELGKMCGIPALDWGNKHEPFVRALVWERHPGWDIEVPEHVVYHDQSHPLFGPHVGCSPDGLILPNRWGLEVKAPYSRYLEFARAGEVPKDYWPQVQFSLWASGWERWIFAAADPRIEDDERYFEVEVTADPQTQARIEELAGEFLEMYQAGEEFKPRAATAAAINAMF